MRREERGVRRSAVAGLDAARWHCTLGEGRSMRFWGSRRVEEQTEVALGGGRG
jgi:hypothetical protein